MLYNIFINNEDLSKSYITYYDNIKCKFVDLDKSSSSEFKFLIYGIVSDYFAKLNIFDFEYVIDPVAKNINSFTKLYCFLYNSAFLIDNCMSEMSEHFIKYKYNTKTN